MLINLRVALKFDKHTTNQSTSNKQLWERALISFLHTAVGGNENYKKFGQVLTCKLAEVVQYLLGSGSLHNGLHFIKCLLS
jgi:hypothetical protein